MYAMQEAHVRERVREAQANAAAHRMASRAASAQRWQRWANWTAHRSAMAQRAANETRMAANVRGAASRSREELVAVAGTAGPRPWRRDVGRSCAGVRRRSRVASVRRWLGKAPLH